MGSEPKMPALPEPAIHNAPPQANAFAYGYHADQMRDYAQAYAAGIRAEVLGEGGECEWTLDDCWSHSTWETTCGESWSFTEGGPEDNNFRFCHGCGKRVKALATLENPNE